MKYKIVLNKTDEGYSVSCPGLPGCWSQGKTEAQAIDDIKDTIQKYLAAVCASVKESKSYLKKVFFPNLCVRPSFQVLDILEYACGLKLGPALTLSQNPIFEMASNVREVEIAI